MSITYFLVSLTNNSNSRATIVVLTTTSSTVKINDNSKTNISEKPSFSTRGRNMVASVYGRLESCVVITSVLSYFDTID